MISIEIKNYLDIVNMVFLGIFIFLTLIVVHFLLISIVGLFCNKKYPHSDKKCRYGCIIPARNEENTISDLINSIRKSDYPQDKLDIFVVAHNCTDNTVRIAQEAGAIVYEYNNMNECTMGFAFKALFEFIENNINGGTASYDGFFLFNADNIVKKDYFTKMNDAFNYYDKKCVITSFRNSRNFNSNVIAGLYGIYFVIGSRFESLGRTVLGISTRVQGTGYVINSELVKNGWNYTQLTEDWEFSADQVLNGNKIKFCNEAIFYDEQPTNLKIMWRQRVRWSRGHLLVFFTKFKDLMQSLFSSKKKKNFSIYDTMINTSPYVIVVMIVFLLKIVCYLFAPLADLSIPATEVYKYILFGDNPSAFLFEFDFKNFMFVNNGYLFHAIRTIIISYVSLFLTAVITFIAERKRIGKMNFFLKLSICLLWPLFIFIEFPIDIQAIFSKNLSWKPIPHGDKNSIKA